MKSKSETKEGIACPPLPPIFCSTRCGPEHGHCVLFWVFYFHIWKKFYLKFITKMLSSFFRYYKMLVSLGLHEYIYNVLHKNARYNSEVFNLYYKNIIQYRITDVYVQNFRILHYSLIIRTYFHKNILIIIYFTMFYTII
jgi:hypothetical protein